ncbi:MAG: NAD-dependent epimerase/dehydratase family protein, partial [Candidatus Omnitrophica bacterium]|nr:NAD-dependent epimerase/dehydratase family protein [Candidatus Omnitrophota bacterium]
FGASKLAADILVQEYGRYFDMKTAVFRGGCLTGPQHAGAELHGFLAYLMKCCVKKIPYTIYGYLGKQVRDNIHCADLVKAFYHFFQNPKSGAVYNIGGGRDNSCSILEAIKLCEQISGQPMNYSLSDQARSGDHQWYISNNQRFQTDFPNWQISVSLQDTIHQIYQYHSSTI